MKRQVALIVEVFIFLLCGTFYGDAQNIKKAASNSEVVWYTSLPLATEAEVLAKAFEKEYPSIKVKIIGGKDEILISRMIAETRAGAYLSDAVTFQLYTIPAMKKYNLLQAYRSPEAKFYERQYKDSDYYWVSVMQAYLVLAYNTAEVTGENIPKDWDDLLDPKWKNNISVQITDYSWYEGLSIKWGREKTKAYVEKLSRNNIQWEMRREQITTNLASGAIALGVIPLNHVMDRRGRGAPIDWVKTTKPVISFQGNISLSRKAPNEKAAKLFIDFLLSKKGQEAVQSFSRISARKDMPFPLQIDRRELDVVSVPPPKNDADLLALQEEFKKITMPMDK